MLTRCFDKIFTELYLQVSNINQTIINIYIISNDLKKINNNNSNIYIYTHIHTYIHIIYTYYI